MRFSTVFNGMAVVSVAVANPIPPQPIPGVNITSVDPSNAAKVITNSWIIQYKSGVSGQEVDDHQKEIKAKLGKDPKAKFSVPGFEGVHVETDDAGIAKIGKNPAILHIERDMTIQLAPMTNNTAIIPTANGGPIAQYLVQQPSATWGLGRISHFYRGYYNYIFDTSACTNTLAYVIDTGIRTSHVEFGGRASWGANFVAGSPNVDEKGHGTHVAGTIIGSSVGVCKNGKAIAVKVLDKTGSGTWSGLMAGMQWAYDNARARNMVSRSVQSISIGGGYYATVNNFVNSIVAQGMTVVVAAGNNGLNTGAYSPSSAASAITVGATDSSDNRAYFSNYGSLVDIFAPGVSVLSSYFTCDTCYYYMDGTSMATPHVSGLSLYFIAKEGISGPTAVVNRLVSASIKNYVVNVLGSPNRLAYNADGY